MQKVKLGRSDLMVSRYCLGSMTWGGPTSMDAAHRQIDMAVDHGISFIDTAEIYPITPVRAETVGRTERIIGLWFDKTGHRGDVVIATQHTGGGQRAVRHGAAITPGTIQTAVEGSLRRLKTEYIDLYQFHWPNRPTYRDRRFEEGEHRPKVKSVLQNMADCLGALEAERKRGTIRHFGLSNETAWGMAQWLRLAGAGTGLRPVAVQNEYSLLCRHHDTDLAELCLNEDVGLIAYAPLALGLLTGKYQGRAKPPDSRMTLMPDLGGRRTDQVFAAVDDYLDVALKHDLDVVGMALAFAASRPFTASVVFGATTEDQLQRILSQTELELSAEVLKDIEAVRRAHPMPF
ncbi:aldo/keto reductase [Pseudooceanicola sp. LIPI14-2-Ac024]|uniref:aldo/keto reductase n=1 Tax=Pseudooceanicola sp. LIPI14-2-Ac024 TaxID=3344875 RepID=UPI0035D03277